MATTSTAATRSRAIWRSRLSSAFRTALACTIVGCITLFGPPLLQHQIAFPALSYVTVILIVTEATLGDTVRGCWHVLYGTIQGVLPAILSLLVIAPALSSSISTTVLAVTLSAFVITLPKSTHMVAKRIALAQVVIAYAVTTENGLHAGAIKHLVHVAASTAIGALASVLALVFPYPRLACYEVRKKCKLCIENASERLNLFVKAFCAENNSLALTFISQANSLVKTRTALLQSVELKQESMHYEWPQYRFLQPSYITPLERLQTLELPLRGMEIALASCASFPVRVADEEIKTFLHSLKEHIRKTLKQSKFSLPSDTSTVHKSKVKGFMPLQAIFPTHDDLPSLFFLFCMNLINNQSIPNVNASANSQKQDKCCTTKWIWPTRISTERLVSALKCSLSLGLAVLFGMIFSKENGYWSGLTVAVGMSFGREATFNITNVKAQGTVLGSIYGVLSCFIFQRFVKIRFISLLPFIIFTSFLRRSRMYGQAGGVSAVIAALIILGRKNYGPPSEFAIVRITEAFIGLSCSIVVEILLQPKRASTLAKIQLSQTLGTLHECIELVVLHASSHGNTLKQKERKLKVLVSELGKLVREAEVEPNFWFLPFHGASYAKLHGSLSNMVELLLFATHAMEFLGKESHRFDIYWKELPKSIDGDLDHFKKMVGSSIKFLEEVTLIKSLATLEKKLQSREISYDLELGKTPYANGFRASTAYEDEMEKIISSFLQHAREVIDKMIGFEEEEEIKNQMVLCLSTLGFCMIGMMKETREIEKGIKELVQWENPSSHVNLYEICCKIEALHT